MAEAVLISIKPEWCELIASGRKTVEVRKTRPKLDTPFKCYIYQTKHKWLYDLLIRLDRLKTAQTLADGRCKVIGEFVCDRVFRGSEGYTIFFWDICIPSQLTEDEVIEYQGDASDIYGWHITNLVIYDRPKKLSEFLKPCPHGEDSSCFVCEKSGYAPDMHIDCFNTVTRPPQSWCYVEEFVGGAEQ